jgi:ureidoglycolate lyase
VTEPLRIAARPLTAEAFAPFGEVLAAPAAIGRDAVDWPVPRLGDPRFCLNLSRRPPASLPFTATVMERHLRSQQSFFPLRIGRFLVLVAPAGGKAPDLDRVVAFIGRAGQGINYRAGIWHHPFTVFDGEAEYASLMFRDGGDLDEEFVDLARPLLISG